MVYPTLDIGGFILSESLMRKGWIAARLTRDCPIQIWPYEATDAVPPLAFAEDDRLVLIQQFPSLRPDPHILRDLLKSQVAFDFAEDSFVISFEFITRFDRMSRSLVPIFHPMKEVTGSKFDV